MLRTPAALAALALLAAGAASAKLPPADDPPSIHHDGFADQSEGRPAKKDLLDGLLPGTWLRQTVVRPGEPQPSPQPLSPADLDPFPHDPAPAGAAESVERETVRLPLPRARDGWVDLEVHHLLGTVTYEPGPEGSFEVTLVRRGIGRDAAAAAAHRDTIRLAARDGATATVVETLAWGFPDFDRAIEYVKRGERPAEAHLFVKAPPKTHAKLCTWGGTVSVANAAGRVEVFGGAGQVDVSGFHGRIEIATTSGPVFLGGGIDAAVLVRTTSGHVYADGFAGDLDARTATGGITVDYRTVGPEDQHLWSLEGSVELTVPRTSQIALDVHAPRDSIVNDLPLTSLQEASQRYRGVLNFPRTWVDVHTDHGRVNVSGR